MKFNPKSEKEIREEGLLEPGKYDFTVVTATEKISKKGNQMIELDLKVFAMSRQVIIRDWLVLDPEKQKKIYDFCRAVGLQKEYERGEILPGDLEGRSGMLSLGISSDPEGKFSDQNRVKYYFVPKEEKAKLAGAPAPTAKDEDEIPF